MQKWCYLPVKCNLDVLLVVSWCASLLQPHPPVTCQYLVDSAGTEMWSTVILVFFFIPNSFETFSSSFQSLWQNVDAVKGSLPTFVTPQTCPHHLTYPAECHRRITQYKCWSAVRKTPRFPLFSQIKKGKLLQSTTYHPMAAEHIKFAKTMAFGTTDILVDYAIR